jgi:hypothetical protein
VADTVEATAPTPVERATTLGHTVEWDPPHALSSVRRWTCTVCSEAVLEREGHVYGEAIEKTCEEAQAVWRRIYPDWRPT